MFQTMTSTQKKSIQIVSTTLIVYLSMKYLLGLLFPFIVGIILVRMLYPLLHWIRRHLKIGLAPAASIILFVVGCLPAAGIYLLVRFLFHHMAEIRGCYDAIVTQCNDCCDRCVIYLERAGIAGGQELRQVLHDGEEYLGNILLVKGVPVVSEYCFRIVRIVSAIGIVWAVIVIFSTMLAKDYDVIRQRLYREAWFAPVHDIGRSVWDMFIAYLKTQIIMFLIIGATVTVGVWIMGYPYPWLIGPGIGILDALPFIGTGITLVPMAIWNVITGRYLRAGGCILLYITCMTLRDFLEPKIMGRHSGIHPILLLVTIFLGIRLYGVIGIITGPISFLLIREICQRLSDKNSGV